MTDEIAMTLAAAHNDVDFLRKNTDFETTDANWECFLNTALRERSYDAFQFLLEKVRLPLSHSTCEMLKTACAYGDAVLLDILHKHYGNECFSTFSHGFIDKNTVFDFIVYRHDKAFAFLLRANAVDIDQFDVPARFEWPKTALTASVLCENYFAFDLLLQAGADPLKNDKVGMNAFDCASFLMNKTMMYELIAKTHGAWRNYNPKRDDRRRFFEAILSKWQKDRLSTLALGLVSLDLPVLCVTKIADFDFENLRGLTEVQRWDICAKVKHFL